MAHPNSRQDRILAYVTQRQHVSITEICEAFSVSPATVRRDLDVLTRTMPHLRRIRGGVLATNDVRSDPTLRQHSLEHIEEKKRIGKAASDLIEDGETVCLGGGTTVLEVAYCLRDRQNLTVITNAVPIMEILKDAPGIMLIGLGGILHRPLQSYIGHITAQALAELHADKVIMGTRAIDLDKGLMNDDPICTQTDRAMLNMGSQVIIVADSSKFGRVATVFVAPLTAAHTLVTDSGAPPDFVSRLSARGLQVLTV